MSVLLEGEREKLNADGGRWDEPCSIQYTSGTTGPSKASLMSQNFVVNWVREMARWWAQSPSDVFYASGLPLFHGLAKGLGALAAVYAGATCVLEERLSISTFWERVHEVGATATACPEAVLMMLWNLESTDLERTNPLRSVIAAPIPTDLLRPMEERWQVRMIGQYALSEAVPLVVGGLEEPLKVGTSGKVRTELFDVRIFNEDDEEMPTGEAGEVVVRPRQPKIMFDGYYGDDDVTRSTWRNLWFHTGDIGKFDAEGNFIFVDRKKDYIRRRAENISSFEVERAVMRFPNVAQVAAVGVPSELGEEDVKVCVVVGSGVVIDPTELLQHCVENMPYYAVPRYIEFVASLPITPSGKVQKHQLRAAGVTPGTWNRDAEGFAVTRDGILQRRAKE
jgi:crotonobetaine/carnitine-CoA ligase